MINLSLPGNGLSDRKAREHLFLLSASSLERFLLTAGAKVVVQERAFFAHYDQFVIAGKRPFRSESPGASVPIKRKFLGTLSFDGWGKGRRSGESIFCTL